MLVVAIITLLAKLVGAGKELVVADAFGTGSMLDAFLFAFLLPSFAINVLAGSFNAAVMPTYIRTRDNDGKAVADKLFSSLVVVGIVLLLVAAGVLAIVGPSVLTLLGSGFNEQTLALSHTLFYWVLPVVVISGIGHLFSTVINAGERFVAVALIPSITPICTVIILLVLGNEWGIYSLAIGLVLGQR